MERAKLKDIVRKLELAIDALKAEVYSDVDAYKEAANSDGFLFGDYDEILGAVSYTHLTLPTKA